MPSPSLYRTCSLPSHSWNSLFWKPFSKPGRKPTPSTHDNEPTEFIIRNYGYDGNQSLKREGLKWAHRILDMCIRRYAVIKNKIIISEITSGYFEGLFFSPSNKSKLLWKGNMQKAKKLLEDKNYNKMSIIEWIYMTT